MSADSPGSPDHTYLGMMKNDMQVMVGSLGGDATIFDGTDSMALRSLHLQSRSGQPQRGHRRPAAVE